jgi:three-Cys-motif partner protein
LVKKSYAWSDGARLEDHTQRKHKILREYFYRYIVTRCQIRQQTRFRLAVVDGFAGGGRYDCGSAGSPIIFIEELQHALETVNLQRASEELGALEIECLLIFNDAEPDVAALLKNNCEPLIAAAKANSPKLHLQVAYMTEAFETAYPGIRQLIANGRYRNVLFNLDQCGHSQVDRATLIDIMRSTPSAEIFYTFSIKSLVAFLHRANPEKLASQLRPMGVSPSELIALEQPISNASWMGIAERLVFESFLDCAPFVSPFSIHNPDGWRYWLIHFANAYRARQVYNDVLHDNSNDQAHYGRSGLNMLSYDPTREGRLYLFDPDGRAMAKSELITDIPRLITDAGDAMRVLDLYQSIYNSTPAHSDDIHAAMLESDELQVLTPTGGQRRKANTIDVGDTLRLKTQRSFFPVFRTLADLQKG